MKRKFLNIISCFLALFIFLSSFVFCFPFRVSAADVSIEYPSEWFNSSVNSDQYLNYFSSLKSNPNFLAFDSGVCMLSSISNNEITVTIQTPMAQFTQYNQWTGESLDYTMGKTASFTCSPSIFSSFSFSSTTSTYPVQNPPSVNNAIGIKTDYSGNISYVAGVANLYNGSPNFGQYGYPVAVFKFDNTFTPDYSLTGVVVGFDFSVEAFTQWLIDTGKYSELPAYIGTEKLKSFVQFYHDWGGSNSIFVIRLVEWFMHFNIASQTIENRNIIKSTIDRLYQEYKNSAFLQIDHDSSILPHHRKNIQTNTTDDDLTLVTDDPSDDTLISILRDILRGVISIPNSIYDNTQVIIAKLDQLNHNIIISNNGGASSGSDLTPVLDKMDDIIEALGSDTVSVEIDQTTKDDTDDFFDDWNLQFSTALNNKFPVASQLSSFFTGFFERCGIDADSDGEVYQYYNPGVLTASSVSRSSGTASEDDIVSDFLGQFDNSDPAFLDDASFHGVPDLSVSVGGQSVSIIDFRVYAKYREKIHFIISFVIWTLYLLHLYKALPSIIGQVADVATKTSEL